MDWSCTGEQSALSVPHRPLSGVQCPHLWWDYRVPTPAGTPASSLPGLRRLHLHDVLSVLPGVTTLTPAVCGGSMCTVTLVVGR